MSFTVVVPDPIRDEIASWLLPADLEELLYSRLQEDLEYGHEHTCQRIAAPSPTFVHYFELEELFSPVRHCFTFWLTYGPQDDCLYVHQTHYIQADPIDF